MNRLFRCIFGFSLIAALIGTTGIAASHAQDYAAVNPTDVKVLIDNDQVRVLEVLHKPGVKEPMHSHPAYVSVYLSASKVKVTLPDGKVAEKDRRAGETQFSGPTTHALENIGTTDQHVIVIELKK